MRVCVCVCVKVVCMQLGVYTCVCYFLWGCLKARSVCAWMRIHTCIYLSVCVGVLVLKCRSKIAHIGKKKERERDRERKRDRDRA